MRLIFPISLVPLLFSVIYNFAHYGRHTTAFKFPTYFFSNQVPHPPRSLQGGIFGELDFVRSNSFASNY